MTNKKFIPYEEYIKLATLFDEAVQHLVYCGYGDNYERECARDDKLPERLEKMSKRIEEIRRLNGG